MLRPLWAGTSTLAGFFFEVKQFAGVHLSLEHTV